MDTIGRPRQRFELLAGTVLLNRRTCRSIGARATLEQALYEGGVALARTRVELRLSLGIFGDVLLEGQRYPQDCLTEFLRRGPQTEKYE